MSFTEEKLLMKVFVADGSTLGSGRLMVLLSDVPGFDLAGVAQDVPTALASIRAMKPDVVILDIEMLGGSGITVLRQVKEELPSIGFIVVTNASNEQYRKKCSQFGADFFFDKSTEFQKVPNALRTLATRSAQQALAGNQNV